MKTFLFVLTCLFSFFSLPVMAESTVYLGAFSQHIGGDSEYDYNQNHNLLAVENNGFFGGYFKNSFREDTLAVGYHLKRRFGDWEPGVILGASYGYRNCEKGYDNPGEQRRVCQVVAPSLTYHGFAETTGVKPAVLLLGNAVALTVGVDTGTVAEKVRGWIGK